MASSADKRVCNTIDVDGNEIALHVGDTVFTTDAYVPNRAHYYRGLKSYAAIKTHTIVAISPKGDKIAFEQYGNRPNYEYASHKIYATTFAQAQHALRARVSEIVEGLRAELGRATTLELALGFIHEGEPTVEMRDPREDPTLDNAPAATAAA